MRSNMFSILANIALVVLYEVGFINAFDREDVW
jgi:hypothetical protein